jgi:hypothetical protein
VLGRLTKKEAHTVTPLDISKSTHASFSSGEETSESSSEEDKLISVSTYYDMTPSLHDGKDDGFNCTLRSSGDVLTNMPPQ